MDVRSVVGLKVRKYRIKKELTQDQLAVRANIARHYLSQLENGQRNPSVEILWNLANALGVSPGSLMPPVSENGRATQPRKGTKRLKPRLATADKP